MQQFAELLYANAEALREIEAHIFGAVETKQTDTNTATGTSSRTSRHLLRLVIAPWSIGGGGEQIKEATRLTGTAKAVAAERELTSATRADKIIRWLRAEKALSSDVYDALNKSSTSGGNRFVELKGRFIPSGWDREHSDLWVAAANQGKALVMHLDNDPQVFLSMSFERMPMWIREGAIGRSSHLAIRMCNNNGAFLRVFGSIDRGKYIRPLLVSF